MTRTGGEEPSASRVNRAGKNELCAEYSTQWMKVGWLDITIKAKDDSLEARRCRTPKLEIGRFGSRWLSL